MKTALRNYQQELYDKTRSALFKNNAVLMQLATGAGKTPILAAMCESVLKKDRRAWVVVNRTELISQSSKHLKKWGVHHGMITANAQESRAYKIHVVSKDTLIRRYDRIKNWPDLLIFDEAHLYIDRQIEIASHLSEKSKIIGMTATPERGDGRGLSRRADGLYDELIEGPSIPELTANGFLTKLRYFSPPIDGLSDLHIKGTDYDEEELEQLLERRKIYGELVGHYEKYGKGKPALIFCRSVKSAYQTAERFRDKGFNFHCIEGKMSEKKRRELIDALTAGTIDGLTNCEIATYGIDIPRVEYGASIRPTLSRALYFQKIGRILRSYENPITGYKKEEALFFDHVNLVQEHQEDEYPGVPPHYVPHINWNFHGNDRRKKEKCPICQHLNENDYCLARREKMTEYKTRCQSFARKSDIMLCPHLDFLYCPNPHCSTCASNPDKTVTDVRRPMIIINTELIEAKQPIPMKERPYEEQREIQDRIGRAVLEYQEAEKIGQIASGAVGELLKIADDCAYNTMWVYFKLTDISRKTINIPLLHEIARIKNFKNGWTYFKIKELRERIQSCTA